VQLDEAGREELRRRARDPKTKPRIRERLEVVRCSAAGWSVPRIAQHFQTCQHTARRWVKAFLQGGFPALADQPHLGEPSCLTPQVLQALKQEIGKGERTWTAQQLADWLAETHHVHVTADWLGQVLRRKGLSYKRTSRSLKHKQNSEQVQSKAADLATIEKGGTPA
jgi:transposase